MKADLHCALEGSSWTDPVTNWTLLAGVRLDVTLARILERGKLPPSTYPAFVHEATHHWCFHTVVGVALSLLHLRARRKALLLGPNPPFEELREIAEAQIRYETAVALLKPLSEGLALYAEFDVFPGPTPQLSIPSGWVTAYFAEPTEEELRTADLMPALERHLFTWRTSRELAERKANLLVQPLRCVEDGIVRGYLPGYLVIKNLHTVATLRNETFTDTDFYSSYVKEFFFGDFGFVDVLLDETRGELDALEAINAYFQKRMRDFAHSFTPENVQRALQTFSGPIDGMVVIPEKPVAGETEARGRQRLTQMMTELTEEGRSEVETKLRRVDQAVIAQRELMCLGSFEARVRRTGEGLVTILLDDTLIGAFPAVPDAGQFDGPGSIAYFLSPARRYRAVSASLGPRTVALGFPSEADEHVRHDMLLYELNRQVVEDAETALRRHVASHLAQSDYGSLREAVRQSTHEILDQIYIPRALNADDADVAPLAEAMKTDGFLPLLGGDPRLVMALALAGNAASASPAREWVENALRSNGFDPADATARITAHGDACRLAMIIAEPEIVLPLV